LDGLGEELGEFEGDEEGDEDGELEGDLDGEDDGELIIKPMKYFGIGRLCFSNHQQR
jgi:hypothetical protein